MLINYAQILLIPTSSKIDLTFCSQVVDKIIIKTEYNLCDNFEALSRSFDQKLKTRFLIVTAIGNRPNSP